MNETLDGQKIIIHGLIYDHRFMPEPFAIGFCQLCKNLDEWACHRTVDMYKAEPIGVCTASDGRSMNKSIRNSTQSCQSFSVGNIEPLDVFFSYRG